MCIKFDSLPSMFNMAATKNSQSDAMINCRLCNYAYHRYFQIEQYLYTVYLERETGLFNNLYIN